MWKHEHKGFAMPVYEFEGVRPVVDIEAFVHPTAVLIGDVVVGKGCFVGPCAVLRGDLGRLTMRDGSNLQDGCIMHSYPGREAVLGEESHVGHGAVLHGCTIGRNTLIGMNAVVMDGATIGAESFVAALALVKAGMEVPPRSLVVGIPARIVRELRDDEIAKKSEGTRLYRLLAQRYRATSMEVEPLREVEANRQGLPNLPEITEGDQ